jgi:hypothetical protein
MSATIARALMALASHCFGEDRREWAHAMEREFEAAQQDERGLSFAGGCLAAALGELPRNEEGRYRLASDAAALLFVAAGAALVATVVAGFPASYLGGNAGIIPLAGSEQAGMLLNEANRCAVPPLAMLVLLLAGFHVRLAWLVLERDWHRVVTCALGAVSVTCSLLLFTAIVFADPAAALVHVGTLVIELPGIALLALWHASLARGSLAEAPS